MHNEERRVEERYFTDVLTREVVSFIDRHHEEPFFLYPAYNAVHSPMQGAASYMNRFRTFIAGY